MKFSSKSQQKFLEILTSLFEVLRGKTAIIAEINCERKKWEESPSSVLRFTP
jgi:hypothetical protein